MFVEGIRWNGKFCLNNVRMLQKILPILQHSDGVCNTASYQIFQSLISRHTGISSLFYSPIFWGLLLKQRLIMTIHLGVLTTTYWYNYPPPSTTHLHWIIYGYAYIRWRNCNWAAYYFPIVDPSNIWTVFLCFLINGILLQI